MLSAKVLSGALAASRPCGATWSSKYVKLMKFIIYLCNAYDIVQRNLRVLSMPLSMMFLMAVHLGNIHSCLYGNQVLV